MYRLLIVLLIVAVFYQLRVLWKYENFSGMGGPVSNVPSEIGTNPLEMINNGKPPAIPTGMVDQCREFITTYGIIPKRSWGTAPEKIMQEWANLQCDVLLDNSP